MNKSGFLLLIVIVIISCLTISAQTTEKERVLKECERSFGKPIDTKLSLFEINQDYVLGVEFDRDIVAAFTVQPKYYWHNKHPEWEEADDGPTLRPAEFHDIVAKLESIKPKGKMVNQAFIAISCWSGNYYENAFLEFCIYPEVYGKSFFVSFFHTVTGEVYLKRKLKPGKYERTHSNEEIFRVKLTAEGDDYGHSYYVRKNVYDRLRKGKMQTFEGAFVN